jgi:hypothetical protein
MGGLFTNNVKKSLNPLSSTGPIAMSNPSSLNPVQDYKKKTRAASDIIGLDKAEVTSVTQSGKSILGS